MEIVSPHDPQARFSHKPGKAEWVGYKDRPRPATRACRTSSSTSPPHLRPNRTSTPWSHADLATHGHAPAEHLVNGGYVTSSTIHWARTEHGIDLVGPVRLGPRTRALPGFNKVPPQQG
ncbi:hypothetical protein [Kitasatospora indigofera]|uniref:hypothetical protein n=1 Tax=Kitasatospora indigofera TaxID=67307 RepID=UPI0033AFADDC